MVPHPSFFLRGELTVQFYSIFPLPLWGLLWNKSTKTTQKSSCTSRKISFKRIKRFCRHGSAWGASIWGLAYSPVEGTVQLFLISPFLCEAFLWNKSTKTILKLSFTSRKILFNRIKRHFRHISAWRASIWGLAYSFVREQYSFSIFPLSLWGLFVK